MYQVIYWALIRNLFHVRLVAAGFWDSIRWPAFIGTGDLYCIFSYWRILTKLSLWKYSPALNYWFTEFKFESLSFLEEPIIINCTSAFTFFSSLDTTSLQLLFTLFKFSLKRLSFNILKPSFSSSNSCFKQLYIVKYSFSLNSLFKQLFCHYRYPSSSL